MTGLTRLPKILHILLGAVILMPAASAAGTPPARRKAVPVVAADPRAWALATTALLAYRNKERVDALSPDAQDDSSVAQARGLLHDWWTIDTRDDLLQTLDHLDLVGHRAEFQKMGQALVGMTGGQYRAVLSAQRGDPARLRGIKLARAHYRKYGGSSFVAWDYCRYIMLCRWGFAVGYLSEEEAWERIMPAARKIQGAFHSWEDLGEDYLAGRELWSSEETDRTGRIYRDIETRLVKDPRSLWNRLPWQTKLGPAATPPSGAPSGD